MARDPNPVLREQVVACLVDHFVDEAAGPWRVEALIALLEGARDQVLALLQQRQVSASLLEKAKYWMTMVHMPAGVFMSGKWDWPGPPFYFPPKGGS